MSIRTYLRLTGSTLRHAVSDKRHESLWKVFNRPGQNARCKHLVWLLQNSQVCCFCPEPPFLNIRGHDKETTGTSSITCRRRTDPYMTSLPVPEFGWWIRSAAWAWGSSRPCDSSELLQVFSSVFIKRLATSSPHMDAAQLYSSTGFHFKSSFEGWRHHNVWSGSSDLEPSWNCSRLLPEFGQSVNQIKLHMVQKTAKKGSEGCWKIPSVIKVMKTFSCCRLTSVRFSRSNFLWAD